MRTSAELGPGNLFGNELFQHRDASQRRRSTSPLSNESNNLGLLFLTDNKPADFTARSDMISMPMKQMANCTEEERTQMRSFQGQISRLRSEDPNRSVTSFSSNQQDADEITSISSTSLALRFFRGERSRTEARQPSNHIVRSAEKVNFLLLEELATLLWKALPLAEYCITTLCGNQSEQVQFHTEFLIHVSLFLEELRQETSRSEHPVFFYMRRIEPRYLFGLVSAKIYEKINALIDTKDINAPDILPMEKAEGTNEDNNRTGEEDTGGLLNEEEQHFFSTAKDFIKTSSAFAILRASVLEFAQRIFQWRLAELISRAEWDSSELETSRWNAFAHEIYHFRPSFITLSHHNKSWVNKLKVNVERWTGEAWDWWPLCPADNPPSAGQTRMKWTCVRRFSSKFPAKDRSA